MKYRSTMIYLAAVLILGAVYLWVIQREKEEQTRVEEAKILFQPAPDDLEVISLERPDGTGPIVIEKTKEQAGGNTWAITAPVRTAVDHFTVNRIARLIPSLKHERIVDEGGSDLARFGLEPPALTLFWRAQGQEGSLSIGERSPVDRSAYYAVTGDKTRVFLFASSDKELLDKGLYDLRDKSLFTLPWDGVKRFVLERPSGSWIFTKSEENMWTLEGAPEVTLNSERISAAVRRLTWEEAASFEDEHTEALKPYGLDKPSFRILLSDGTLHEELLLGDPVGLEGKEDRRYARMASGSQVMTVRETLLNQHLPSSLGEFVVEDTE